MDLIFETPKRRPFSIEIGFFDSVLEIKEKVQKYQGIPVSKQTLIFKGQVLQDEGDVEHCELLHNSHVQLIIAPDIDIKPTIVKVEESSSSSSSSKIQLILKKPSSKTPIPLEMDPANTVSQIKDKICKMEGVPVTRLVLYSNGNELQDHNSLRDSELFDKCEIDFIVKPLPTQQQSQMAVLPTPGGNGNSNSNNTNSKKLKIKVLTQCGTMKIPVEVNASDNVAELRKELQKLQQQLNFHLPSEGYFFIYKQNVMDDDRSFRWHHVSNGETVEIFNGSVTGGSS
ncbi:hypothetical protein LguiA_025335 [Lonicera macranthoides]